MPNTNSTLCYEVYVNGRFFGASSFANARDALVACARPLGVPSVTIMEVK